MIHIRNLKVYPEAKDGALKKAAAKKLRVPPEMIEELKLTKKSLDARKKDDIHYVCAAAVKLRRDEAEIIKRANSADVTEYKPVEYVIPAAAPGSPRPVVVGFGPAGMFAALVLSRAGARPIVLERGQDAVSRKAAVERFRAGGELDEHSNVQFGEGGAGTFSDGKLNTGTKDKRISFVLREFFAHGAPEDVTWDAKPHVGTDVLINVVRSIREEIISLGGEVRFESKMERLLVRGGKVCGVEVKGRDVSYILECEKLILAPGHSARDSFEMLRDLGVIMERKPFSMGVRIEHLQKDVDLAQYGRERGALPPADYSLNVHLPDGESAYTFCMCPGGYVMAAASEKGGVVTNGMSYSGRSGENANAALLVTLKCEDFPAGDVLSGMYWQREIEQRAFKYGGDNYLAPAQRVGDFLARRESAGPGRVKPSYVPDVIWGDIHDILPEKITAVLEKAIPELGKKLSGFDDCDAVLTAPETRSSSPVRIVRGADFNGSVRGLYPCGEGAGYAGGITSAAVDGLRCAEAVLAQMAE